MSDEPKEIMSQEDIDAYLSSVSENNNPVQGQDSPLPQHAGADDKLISQDDIDALISLSRQVDVDSPPQAEQGKEQVQEESETEAFFKNDIDALIRHGQQSDEYKTHNSEQRETGAALQEHIDALLNQHQAEKGSVVSGSNVLDPDSGVQPHKNANAGKDKEVWETLDQNILSQEEIDALLKGFAKPESELCIEGESEVASSVEHSDFHVNSDNIFINENRYEDRIRQREEAIIKKKQKAAAIIQELLKSEEARINSIMALKGMTVNEDLFARYEIIRPDRTKVIVSMSDNTIMEYRQIHPDCCVYRS
ncbi:hypothetical protein PITCH_A840019 [uncultured Desulfobacterium sp.]|uniref:Uncharacterized protein n=1 Tax=uncultured Desulfobacterium sp. TaxID=201089 RepID=A0A445N375_9BACT|nr:hypothetical protein PITCH_A840019 [uncultured Desulfobacterium sp.]